MRGSEHALPLQARGASLDVTAPGGGDRLEPRDRHAAYIAYGFEGRVYAHRACALKLWLICERQRALLAEIQDGLLDQSAILQRRDALTRDTHSAYDQTFPLDQSAYESVRQWAGDAVPSLDAGVH